jgi:transposase
MPGKAKSPEILEVDASRLAAIVARAESGQVLSQEDCALLRTTFASYAYLTELLQQKNISISRLKKLLFGAGTETTATVLGNPAESPASAAAGDQGQSLPSTPASAGGTTPEATPPKPPSGHGRNGADAYSGAQRIAVSHGTLTPGDHCPECQGGTLYRMPPAQLLRIVGQAPVQAKRYELERLRCHLCGRVFTASLPEDAGTEKYDVTVASMIALLKYGTGMPFNRFESLQGTLGIPLPASTQWELVASAAAKLVPILQELIRQAAQGDVVYNDDTTGRILELMGQRRSQTLAEQVATAAEQGTTAAAPERRGLFTSGIVSTCAGRRVALFFTGPKHAGENLREVLARRAEELGPPIQMCDALSRNMPAELQTIVANCLAHGRRQFVDVAEHFPEACRHVLEALQVIYHNDAVARTRQLSPAARLQFHQAESAAVMEDLHQWLTRQIEDRQVEPNSGLGAAITYLLKHWAKLTLFLRQAGAPLDNNVCERALKKAILHRKNAYFYKTQKGADVGDLFMSLIYTCELCGANPFDYLTELQRHAPELAASPEHWLPWNYRQTLDALAAGTRPTASPA